MAVSLSAVYCTGLDKVSQKEQRTGLSSGSTWALFLAHTPVEEAEEKSRPKKLGTVRAIRNVLTLASTSRGPCTARKFGQCKHALNGHGFFIEKRARSLKGRIITQNFVLSSFRQVTKQGKKLHFFCCPCSSDLSEPSARAQTKRSRITGHDEDVGVAFSTVLRAAICRWSRLLTRARFSPQLRLGRLLVHMCAKSKRFWRLLFAVIKTC